MYHIKIFCLFPAVDEAFLLSELHVAAMFQCLEAVEQNDARLLALINTTRVSVLSFVFQISLIASCGQGTNHQLSHKQTACPSSLHYVRSDSLLCKVRLSYLIFKKIFFRLVNKVSWQLNLETEQIHCIFYTYLDYIS